MNTTKSRFYFLVCLAVAGFTACDDDDITGTLEGTWLGDKTEIKGFVTGIPLAVYNETDEDFDDEIVFETDGTLVVRIDGDETTGAWEWTEKNRKVAITANFGIAYLDPTEVFTVKELSETRLTLYLEKDDTVEDPDSGQEISGTIKATLYFVKG